MSARVAMIAAAAGGIGSALARHLATQGYRMALADVSRRRLEKVADAIEVAGGERPVLTVGDLTDPSVVDEFTGAALAIDQRIDALANVTGGVRGPLASFYDRPLAEVSLDEWEWTMRINTVPSFLLTKAVAVPMQARGGGSIVNVASMAYRGSLPLMGNVAYDGAKAAVVAFTRTLARQLGPANIRVNAVAPGLTLSSGLERIVTDELIEAHQASTPLGKVGRPEDIATALAFLMGEDSGHVTGEVLHVAGGVR